MPKVVTSYEAQAQNAKALQRAVKNMTEALGSISVGGRLGASDVGVELTNSVKELLSRPGRGRLYRVPGTKTRVHQASAPGEPPAVLEGRLRSSYNWRTGQDAKGFFVEVGTNVEYAPFLEFGTVKMEARPHVRPAVEGLRTRITAAIADGIVTTQKATVRRLPSGI